MINANNASMTVAELETWLKAVRELGVQDNALVLVITGTGEVTEIDYAEPYDGSVGAPVLVLA